MNNSLKDNIQKFIEDLNEKIIKLENTSGTEARIERNTLNNMVDWLEVLLDSNQWNEFRQYNNKETYFQKRVIDISDKFNTDIKQLADDYFNLGMANVFSGILFMINKECDIKSIKEHISKQVKDNFNLRNDTYGILGDMQSNKYW